MLIWVWDLKLIDMNTKKNFSLGTSKRVEQGGFERCC